MYKVFFNDSFLLVTDSVPQEKDILVKPFEKPMQLDEWIETARTNANSVKWALETDQPERAWQLLTTHFPVIEAAGGLIQNPDNKYLFIYRRKRWDLPKGKVDAGETPEKTALREVEEETGLAPLKISKFLTYTYHIYFLKERFTLKRTHWYLMHYNGDKQPVPQAIEDIEQTVWMTIEEFHQIKEPIFGTVYEVISAAK